MRQFFRNQSGFTLVEVIITVGILTTFMGTIGGALYQSMSSQKVVVNDGVAVLEERRAFSWFSGDARMANATTLVDGAPAASTVTFNWTDEFNGAGTAHTVSYTVSGGALIRTYDGQSETVARGVVSASFSRSGKLIVANLTVTGKPGATRDLSVRALMRTS